MDWHARNINFNDLIKQLFHEKEIEKRAEAARQLGFLKDGRAVNLLCRALNIEDEPMVDYETADIPEALEEYDPLHIQDFDVPDFDLYEIDELKQLQEEENEARNDDTEE